MQLFAGKALLREADRGRARARAVLRRLRAGVSSVRGAEGLVAVQTHDVVRRRAGAAAGA